MSTVKLSKTQQELFDAMKAGTVVQFVPSWGSRASEYFSRNDKPVADRKCTAAARTLLGKGLCEKYDQNMPRFGMYKLRIKEAA